MRAGLMGMAVLLGSCGLAGAVSWEPVSGAKELEALYRGARLIGTSGPTKWVAEYCADGTGAEWAWGVRFSRTWTVRNDQVCITSEDRSAPQCIRVERSTADPGLARAVSVATGELYEFRKSEEPARCDGGAAYTPPPAAPGKPAEGHAGPGAAAVAITPAPTAPGKREEAGGGPSTAEMAAKLANPSAAVGQMSSNLDLTSFGGSLPDASEQIAFAYAFQPTIPFPLENGKSFFFRPAIPVLVKQPVYDGEAWRNEFALGEISFDLAYGGTNSAGLMTIVGAVATLPTATNDAIGAGHWAFGPELIVGLVKKWGVFGLLATHRWDVAGSEGTKTNLTSGQYFYAFPFGDGTTQIAAGPGWSYDHELTEDKLTLPLGIGLAKTTSIGGSIWKFGLEYWYYVRSSDIFGPRHQVRLIVTPVVSLPWQK